MSLADGHTAGRTFEPFELLGRVLAERLEHAEAHLPASVAHALDHRAIAQRLEHVDHGHGPAHVEDALGGVEAPSVAKHGTLRKG